MFLVISPSAWIRGELWFSTLVFVCPIERGIKLRACKIGRIENKFAQICCLVKKGK